MTTSKEIHLKSRPTGVPATSNFELVERDIGDPGPGEVLIRNIFMSVDPYMRGRMREAWPTGEVLQGAAVGKVIATRNDQFKEGDYVTHGLGWREYLLSDGKGVGKVDESLAPISTYLGIMGMPGLTAYGGLLKAGQYKDGETLFVSAASGAVGSVVGQIARIKGGVVIGSAGSDAKVRHLVEEFGFSHAFNYKTADPLTELRKGAPDGIDVYFENVGGPQLEAALTHMKEWGRIAICGMIAHYNDDGANLTPGPRNLTETIYKHITMRGFVVSEYIDLQATFRKEMAGWLKSGEIKYHETVYEGIGKAVEAFIGLFSGANDGKMVVRLADD